MYDREQLLSMIGPFYTEIKQKNSCKIKTGDLKETVNKFLRIKSAIESSKIPEEEKNTYKSKIYRVLRCSNYNIEKTNERVAKNIVKDICFCLEEISANLKENSYKKIKNTSK